MELVQLVRALQFELSLWQFFVCAPIREGSET